MRPPHAIASDLALLGASLARSYAHERVVALGGADWAIARLAHPELDLVDLRPGPTDGSPRPSGTWTHRVIDWPAESAGSPSLDRAALGRSVALIPVDPAATTNDVVLRSLLDVAPVIIVTSPGRPEALAQELRRLQAEPTLVGLAPAGGSVAIVDRVVSATPATPPGAFRVLAIMTAYNEADIIGPSIDALLASGVSVHLIDNWSNDGTYEIAAGYRSRGLIELERHPEAPTATFDLGGLLQRVEAVAGTTPADWYIHHDADERRSGPWPGRTLRESIWTVDRSGFNAVDHIVLTFEPVDEDFMRGTDVEQHFRHFEFGRTPDLRRQIKAWSRMAGPVRLAESGGHEAAFEGRRVFPYRFLLKHYPIRSQAHGERKVLHERQGRWNPAERAKGWHIQYEAIDVGHVFTRPAGELIEFVPGETERRYLVPMISGIGLFPTGVPAWATRDPVRAAAYRLASRLVGASASPGLRSTLGKLPIVGGPARRAWRRLMGAR
jgi:hypothetical protein